MPKQLLIVRHAKSDWGDPDLADFDRPLNKRGHRNAPEMAKRLLKKGIIPEHLVSSPARRAITTARYFADTFQIAKKKIQQEKSIYEASASELLKVVNKLDDRYDFVTVFGHNPGMSALAMNLCEEHTGDLPTCGVVLLSFPFDSWQMVSQGTGELQLFDYPKKED